MKCRKCGNYFPIKMKINGAIRNLGSRKYCIDCSPFGTKNTRKLERQHNQDILGISSKECTKCHIVRPLDDFYQNGKHLHSHCRFCIIQSTLQYQRDRKKVAVDYKGGYCQFCGYNKSSAALEFHHTDPDNKDLNVSRITNMSDGKLFRELDKCILLCANCHRELHEELVRGQRIELSN